MKQKTITFLKDLREINENITKEKVIDFIKKTNNNSQMK